MELSRQSYTEVYSLLKELSPIQKEKIPHNILKYIESQCDKSMNISIEDIENYQLSLEAKKILVVIYKKYFATEEKKIIEAKEKAVYNKREIEDKKYSINVFEKYKKQEKDNTKNLPLVIEKEKLIKRIIMKIKNLFQNK